MSIFNKQGAYHAAKEVSQLCILATWFDLASLKFQKKCGQSTTVKSEEVTVWKTL